MKDSNNYFKGCLYGRPFCNFYKVKVKVSVQDNFDEIRVRVNGDERFAQDLSEPYKMAGFKKDLELELSLVDGKNTFVIEVEDLVGHKTTKKIEIRKMKNIFENWGK